MLGIRTQPSLSRDFTLLSVFIVLILVVVSVWVTIETLANHSNSIVRTLESEAQRVDRAMSVEIENTAYLLESLGRQIETSGTTNRDAIRQLFFSFAKSEKASRAIFSWVDTSQQVIISSNLGILRKPIDVSDRDYVKKSIAEPWKAHMGRPIMGRLSQKVILPISVGLADENGVYLGTVVAALDATWLTAGIAKTIQNTGVEFAITTMNLSLITPSPQTEKFFASNFDIAALSKMDFSGITPASTVRPSIFHSDQIFTHFERSSFYPFLIFVGINASETATSVHKILLPRLFQLAIIALFLLFVLWTVRKRIIHPVMQLTYRTAALTRGERFSDDPLVGPIEIEQLAYEIRRLYDYLEERRRVESELRLKNAELTRVKEAATLTNKVKADFFAYVGQELVEPAETIHEQIDIIKDQLFGPIENSKYLQHARAIHDQSQQLLEMLNDIKAIAEAETGLLALEETELELGFVLQKTVRIFRDRTPLDVQVDVNSSFPRIRGDDLRLKQMLLSILNAIARHCAMGDNIRISGQGKPQEYSLHFSYQASLNEKTNRMAPTVLGHTSRTKHGLELAMARLLIGMHQGSLEMKTTQDRTTTITLKFPALRIV